uniref:Phosphatase tensin-type domain-containing protein n=1 Tax=Macrostomum lignano TaxID=282301 RepID=A0A1I8F594_9PLAT
MSVPDLSDTAKLGKLVVLARLIRLPPRRPGPRVSHREEKPHQGNASRGVAEQEKKRYEDDGFDLDLCYITVAKFLDLKHYNRYKVYNLCSERYYDSSFFHDRVERYLIDDHNVPRLSDMVKFANSVRDWLAAHEQNIIVVHCKGGKGRTGTMICTYMECLDFFGLKRTDYQQGIKFQGVETPSQNRYVGYFETVKKEFNYEMPPDTPLIVRKIIIHGISFGEFDLGINKNCIAEFSRETDSAVVTLRNPPTVAQTMLLTRAPSSTYLVAAAANESVVVRLVEPGRAVVDHLQILPHPILEAELARQGAASAARHQRIVDVGQAPESRQPEVLFDVAAAPPPRRGSAMPAGRQSRLASFSGRHSNGVGGRSGVDRRLPLAQPAVASAKLQPVPEHAEVLQQVVSSALTSSASKPSCLARVVSPASCSAVTAGHRRPGSPARPPMELVQRQQGPETFNAQGCRRGAHQVERVREKFAPARLEQLHPLRRLTRLRR